MRSVELPHGDEPLIARSVRAAVATILELDPAVVPFAADHPAPWTRLRNWLAQRGLGLVPVPEPAAFEWAGPWLALLGDRDRPRVAAVAFGVPSGLVWLPAGVDGRLDEAEAGFVLAPLDVALWTPAAARPAAAGVVEAIAVTADAEGPMSLVGQAKVRAGCGIEGDRYEAGRGTFSNPNALGIDLTLVEAEVLDALSLPSGARLDYAEARRNVVTRGVDLNALVGRRFLVGDVECLGQRLCEPCAHLERLTTPGALRALVHRGGLRADVLTDGVLEVGVPVRPLEPPVSDG